MEGAVRRPAPYPPRARRSPADERRRRARRRAIPVIAIALVAFVAGLIAGAGHGSSERAVAQRFADAWQRADYARMYSLVDDRARRRTSLAAFLRSYRAAAATATATGVVTGRAGKPHHGAVAVPVRVPTRVFGTLALTERLPLSGSGSEVRIAWRPELAFPGVAPGQALSRETRLPARAAILARNSVPLAQEPGRTSPLGPVAAEIVGSLGPVPPDRRDALRAAGYPPGARVGVSGLERALESRLVGTPGGELRVGPRVIARARARPAHAVRTTIAPGVESAAIAALAGRLGGIAVIRPHSGEVLALAGLAFSSLQPPGSTFKMVTATAALEAHAVTPSTPFPVQTFATLEGVKLENANGESCGGTFAQAFANSCNSVFAPLGAKLGARKLVATAERFGFNEPPSIPGAATSSIPPADQIGGDLAVGSSAIGQGKVQATALQMAVVAATIANHGRRPRPTLVPVRRSRLVRVTSRRVARTVEKLMLGVVQFGTGTAAAIPGVKVAGKTGTAELKTTVKPDTQAPPAVTAPTAKPEPPQTDAWFAAYAPAGRARVALGVLLVRAGGGGQVAAPAARSVLEAALKG